MKKTETNKRETCDDKRLICHECAQRLNNRWAFYQLIYNVRGEHICEECNRSFGVRHAAMPNDES
jgi:hypothetical protein